MKSLHFFENHPNTMSTESTQYHQDWEPVFTDNHTEHAATTCKFAVLGTSCGINIR